MSLTFAAEAERDVIAQIVNNVETLLREARCEKNPAWAVTPTDSPDPRVILMAAYETAGRTRDLVCSRLGIPDNIVGADVLKKAIDLANRRL